MARIACFAALICFLSLSMDCPAEYNPVTGNDEPVYISPEQEVEMGDSIAKKVEAVYKLEVKDFPLTVCIDAKGRDIYDQAKWKKK